MKLLEVKNLSIYFNQNGRRIHAVKDLSFDVYSGEILGLVGESGSGKSVTAMSILRLLPSNGIIDSGSITWNYNGSKSLLDLKEDDLRTIRLAEIAMIFQEPMTSLNPVLTCGSQVAEGYAAHIKATKHEIKAKVIDLFTKLGLSEPERVYRSYPHELSGGQLQRVLIALALICMPKLVIADEPTTALDVTIQRKLIQLLLDLKAQFGLTIIFISHDLGLVKHICDRVLIMRNGEAVEQNDIKIIFENPKHPYTKGLIYSRAPLDVKLRQLPVVDDFLSKNKSIDDFMNDMNVIINTEQDRQIDLLKNQRTLLKVENMSVEYSKEKTWYGRSKSYFKAVDDISFELFPSEVLGVVGESGSGKSSLGKAILGLTKMNSGKVFYRDQDISELNFNQWKPYRKRLQIVFQDPYSALNPRQKIGDAIIEPMEVHHLHHNTKLRKEKAIQLLEEVGLSPDHYDRYPHQFSGGQRQRICIARALALEPEFIVCDEAVSALDVSVQAQVLNLLQDLRSKFKLSYLFISHDLSVINFIADRVMVMKAGRIVEQGPCHKIIQQPSEEYTKELINSIFH